MKLPLYQHYQDVALPKLMKEFGYKTPFQAPKLKKIVLNAGVTSPQDPRARKPVIENVVSQFQAITGQAPMVTKAKKSIAGFKLRQGDPVGVMVTLRGRAMWNFLYKLIKVALPRVKDFRGIPDTAFDGKGTYSLGVQEQIIFPEINYDVIDSVRSLQIVMTTSATSTKEAKRLLELLEMPFKKKENE